jgi:hypothetical protein
MGWPKCHHLRPQRQTDPHLRPNDNPDRILHTSQRTVGRKDINYKIGLDLGGLPLTG